MTVNDVTRVRESRSSYKDATTGGIGTSPVRVPLGMDLPFGFYWSVCYCRRFNFIESAGLPLSTFSSGPSRQSDFSFFAFLSMRCSFFSVAVSSKPTIGRPLLVVVTVQQKRRAPPLHALPCRYPGPAASRLPSLSTCQFLILLLLPPLLFSSASSGRSRGVARTVGSPQCRSLSRLVLDSSFLRSFTFCHFWMLCSSSSSSCFRAHLN